MNDIKDIRFIEAKGFIKMIKLSERLQVIAGRLGNIKTMADIGTDHGFLPVHMLLEGQCEKAILTDISSQSLAKAELCCKKYLAGGYELRQGDGLSVLEAGEADAVVIAGMGGNLIADMIKADMYKALSVKKFVFQPRTGQGYLRKWLLENGFSIIGEDLVSEGDFIPEIITAVPDAYIGENTKLDDTVDLGMFLGKIDEEYMYKVPAWIIHADGLVKEFLERNMRERKRVLENVMLSKKRNIKTEENICESIYYIKALLEMYGEK